MRPKVGATYHIDHNGRRYRAEITARCVFGNWLAVDPETRHQIVVQASWLKRKVETQPHLFPNMDARPTGTPISLEGSWKQPPE